MNLVAKEAPILSERGCALVLSREAGAADELGADALLVNPFDVSGTAQALHEALCLEEGERYARSDRLATISGTQPALRLAAQPAGRPRREALRRSGERLGEPAQEGGDGRWAVEHEVGGFGSPRFLDADALATSRALVTPAVRSRLNASKAGRSPASSPMNRTTRGRRSATRARYGLALSRPGSAQLQDEPPRPDDQSRAGRDTLHAGTKPIQRKRGLGGRSGVDGNRVALVLEVRTRLCGHQLDQRGPGRGEPGRRLRVDDRATGPTLGAVPPEHEQTTHTCRASPRTTTSRTGRPVSTTSPPSRPDIEASAWIAPGCGNARVGSVTTGASVPS